MSATKSGTKRFLTKLEKQKLIELYEKGFKLRDIAKNIGSSTRQVKEHVRRYENNIVKKFTPEEDDIIRAKYLAGMTKEWQIWTFIPNKEPYMIRNRIKTLLRKNLMYKETTHVPEDELFVSIIPQEETDNTYIDIEPIDFHESQYDLNIGDNAPFMDDMFSCSSLN